MGLDVTAYRRIQRVAEWPVGVETIDEVATYDDGYTYNGEPVTDVHPIFDRSFPEHRSDLTAGIYTYTECASWCAGSYSGYGAWRDWLSIAALGVSAKTVWRDFDAYRNRGVAWLINFSDCEGYIGPAVCRLILDDIRAHEDAIRSKATGPDADYYLGRLDVWLAGLEVAADGGMLSFS